MIDVKKKLREKEVPRDLAEAEELLKKHQDLKDEILAGRERQVSVCVVVSTTRVVGEGGARKMMLAITLPYESNL